MPKFLSFLVLFSAIALSGEDLARDKFLLHYYRGDYEKAHEILADAFQNPVTRKLWEQRIHLNQNLSGCSNYNSADNSARALALLRKGSIQEAKAAFGDDWISLWGKAMVSLWENRPDLSRSYIRKALPAAENYPDVLFFAADVAPSIPESIEFFTKYLQASPEDPIRSKVAEYGIEFMKKTENIPLNVVSFPDSATQLDSKFRDSRLTIEASIDGKKDSTLLVDTGAGGLTLKEAKWQPQVTSDLLLFGLGKKQFVKTKRVVLSSFKTGDVTIKNPVAALNNSLPGGDLNGVAGAVLFSNRLILLPMTNGKKMALLPRTNDPVGMLKSKGYKFSEQQTLPFYIVHKMMILKGRIKNSPPDMDILLDTGAESTIVSAATARKYTHINYPLSQQANKSHTFSGIGGRVENVLLAENVDVQIGSITKSFNRMLALNLADTCEGMDLEIDMIVGRDFLGGYSLLIDYQKAQVTFLR